MYEKPAAPPAEMEGSTYIDEHYPLERYDEKVVETGDWEKKQGEVMEQGKEVG